MIADKIKAPHIDAKTLTVDGKDLFDLIKKMQAQIDALTGLVKSTAIQCHYGYKLNSQRTGCILGRF